ncbi:hypothetical protein CFP65_1821 [Kitasatospora sp. MMS16-BH015]|uniref:DUF3052 domain-containing protein n=1 Tax=Kitasatospora sp. MMS16-BH015 TaxID=2018025 RepID=UPI000CA1089E|nr:DUF3052 domain-containing protein [Kitasatospora sp. MMS16-BH015]AUG76695.1 hypothetical protein CFP65_1821 [Kitasatospora sp. MMS16-BH015]
MAGYSATPLPRKLGIGPDSEVVVIGGTPPLDLPFGGTLVPFDVALWYPADRAELADRLGEFRSCMRPAAGLWIAWPKKAARIPTDLGEDVIRAVLLPTGLVDNKVCAIDDTYSGLRFVIRRELR